MKVLLINNCFYRRGGSETVFFNTAELLEKAGHEVTFFSIKSDMDIEHSDSKFFVEEKGKLSRIISYFYNHEAEKKMDELLASKSFDVAHVHLIWGGVTSSVVKALKRHNVPVVHTVHDYRMVCPAYTLKNGVGSMCVKCKGGHFWHCITGKCCKKSLPESVLMTAEMYYRNGFHHPTTLFDSLIYVSQFGKDIHEQMDTSFKKIKSHVLYNFVFRDKDSYRITAESAYNSYYLYFGRLSFEKGVLTLLKAFEAYPQLKLIVLGSGPLENELKQYVNHYKLNNVSFLEARSGESLYKVVSQAKFIAAPSEWYEMMGMTVVEGYSMGVPALASNIGGLSEIVIDKETGFLFNAGDVESIKASINRCEALSVHDYSKMREKAYTFGEGFGEKMYLNKLLNIYQEVSGLLKE